MKKCAKIIPSSVVALALCIVCAFVFCASGINKQESLIASERHIVLTNSIDADSVLNKYENASYKIDGMQATFDGYQTLDPSVLSDIDNISEQEIEAASSCRVHYTYTYNVETNIVTISAEMENEYGEINIDQLSGIAFINEAGEIDAVLNVDGEENVLLSDLTDISVIDNVGWLSRLIKNVVSAVVAVAFSTGASTVITHTIGNLIGNIAFEQTQAYINYQHNKKLDGTITGLVNGQKNYPQWKFGMRTFDYNGCGVIATYNAMYLLNRKQLMSQVAYDIEKRQGTLVFGFAGTDPTHPYDYFRDKGIAIKQYYSHSSFDRALGNMRSDQCALMCFWNNKNSVLDGAHFVAFKKNANGKYVVYNYDSSSTYSNTFNTLNKIIDKGKLISGFIVN